MENNDYYRILGVFPGADKEEIREAYRRLAKQWHPDRHQNESAERQKYAEEMFQDIQEAYDGLMNGRTSSRNSWEQQHDYENSYGGESQNQEYWSQYGGGGVKELLWYLYDSIIELLYGLFNLLRRLVSYVFTHYRTILKYGAIVIGGALALEFALVILIPVGIIWLIVRGIGYLG